MATDLEQGGVATVEEASGKPSEMPWISPYLTVKNPAASIAFYEAAFGFTTKSAVDGPDGTIIHASMAWNDSIIMMGPSGFGAVNSLDPVTSGVSPAVSMYVYVPDVDALHDRAVAAGAKVLHPLHDSFWGDRHCMLGDPDGHMWSFATNKAAAL